ncbi:hypothetical protein Taro_003974 [Colocasia esculenta]|uniref:Uncharacterized protein n=1 Tax=Colocasia esculenta TaxID=4460 RepID=A0A843TN85_COLES|nr:hypothetical protein [Colocasia esculenta]
MSSPRATIQDSLPKGTVPLKDTYTPSHNWSSLHNPKRNTTPCNPQSHAVRALHTLNAKT